MKKFLLVTAALLVATPAAQAHTSENVLFTCEGELIKFQGHDGKNYYVIVESWKEEERVNRDIAEGAALRQVLAVCRVGDFCTVGAKGESGNGPSYLIQKVFEVQRQPASRVQELKRDFKQ
jgi:opacity protein-like surface antigen